jgi:hypothetical protein
MPKTYDPACYALAEHFLRDEPCAADPVLFAKHCDAMAREIQQVNEDWHYDERAEKAA